MDAHNANWNDVPEDNPIPLLTRRIIKGEKLMIAKVSLRKGCHVALHHHESEQIAIHVSGKMHWKIGEPGSKEYREVILEGGEVVVLPSNVPHSVDALEDSVVFDTLSPIGPMGVDSQKR